jgi:hypothetical protein
VIKVDCMFCGASKSWSSWTRQRGHLSGDDAMALGAGTTKCPNVPPEVAAKFKDIVTQMQDMQRRRSAVRRAGSAVDAAIVTAARPTATKQQRSIESAFSTQNRTHVDAAVANCFYACNISLSTLNSVTFKRMVEALKTAPPSYRPPDRHRFTGDLLETTEARLEGVKEAAYGKMIVFGVFVAVDAATVHGEPLLNCAMKIPTVVALHLATISAKDHIASEFT